MTDDSKTTDEDWREPIITINGVSLTIAQAMTVRVAIQSLAMSLEQCGLGDDEHGRKMTEGYLGAINGINGLIAREL